jgi:hypothetical protein
MDKEIYISLFVAVIVHTVIIEAIQSKYLIVT